MVDKNKIIDIKSAQELDYGGRKLTSQEKELLESEYLKKSDGITIDKKLLIKAAELLEVIIEAKKVSKFDGALYSKLNLARGETKVIKALDENGFYQSAVDHLNSYNKHKKDDEKKNDDDIDKLIAENNVRISYLQKQIDKKKKIRKEFAKEHGGEQRKVFKNKKRIEKLRGLKYLLENETESLGGNTNIDPINGKEWQKNALYVENGVNNLSLTYIDPVNGTSKTQHINHLLGDMAIQNESDDITRQKYFHVKISNYCGGRGWVTKNALSTLSLQLWNVFQKVGKDEFFKKATHISSGDATKLKSYWDKWEKIKWSWKNEGPGSLNPNYLVGKGEVTPISKLVTDRPDDIWPVNFFNFAEFLELIRIVFKDVGSSLPSSFVTLVGGESKGEKYKWLGYSEEPFNGLSSGPYETTKWLESKGKINEKGLNEKIINSEVEFIEFIQNAFTDQSSNAIISKTKWDSITGGAEYFRLNTLRELFFVKKLREIGVGKEVITDHELISFTQLSRDTFFKRRNKEKASYSQSGSREFKNIKSILTQQGIEKYSLGITKVDTSKSDYRARIDTSPLDLLIADGEAEIKMLEGDLEFSGKGGGGIYEQILELELQKRELEDEIIELEREKSRDKDKGLPELKKSFKELLGVGDDLTQSILGKFNRIDLSKLRSKIDLIKEKESPVDKWILDAEKKIKDDIRTPLSRHDELIDEFKGLGDNDKERIKNCNDNLIKSYWSAYDEAERIIKLKQSEKDSKEVLRKKKDGEEDKDEDKDKDLNEQKLTALFDFAVDAALLSDWKKVVNGKTIKEDKIRTIISDKYAPTKSGYNGLIAHLKAEGDVDGKKDYKVGSDDEKKSSWETFIKKGPEKVIKTIVAYENHADLGKTIDADHPIIKMMKEDSVAGYDTDHAKCKFNKDRYGNPEDFEGSEKPTREKLINYLFDKKLGNVTQQSSVWEESNGGGSPTKDEEGGIMKHLGDNWYWYVGGIILIIVLLGVVFWKQISEWWNGPAEEQDEGKVGEDEKEEEAENG